jgi:hypothetical protein
MPAEMLTRDVRRVLEEPLRAARTPPDARDVAGRRYAARVRRVKRAVVAWGVWTILVTTLWVTHQWGANGSFERFGHEGAAGQWNPTLWALGIGIPTLIVGIMALAVRFVKPTDPAPLGRQRLKFHSAAWLFGMVVLTPLWLLIEWQDNGGFERWSGNSRPGDWDPWILTVGGIWALSVGVLFAVRRLVARPSGDS